MKGRIVRLRLRVEGIKKQFENKEVLKGASFTFEQGKIYGLIGRNGAGKTTFFNCLNEDILVDEGSYVLEDNGVTRPLQAEDLGYVLSTPVVPEFLTAREFLKFFLDINKNRLKDTKSIDEYLEFMKIKEEDRDKLLKDYSHGMKNKVQMLVNFIANPMVLLLDEPLTSFDVIVADEMKRLLREMKNDHIIIFSTHIMELALDLCDEIVILNEGILTEIPKQNLDNTQYKDRIINALKGEENDSDI
ncbi:ABC transporter ATP-binding protein [Anaerosporobacter faecicola]|uniref:ABC transporter ATP-binding protein n=1 Tax=Anaerosporobacter faecicola TaxID=2718714 RepID=UPI001EE5AE25|nr:ABC transporter ATP-binding protein [Anaerosporobacter faecicola]